MSGTSCPCRAEHPCSWLVSSRETCDSRASGGRVLPGPRSPCSARVPQAVSLSVQVAELYEELKSRISQFNMNAGPRRPALDQEYTHKQRFILQVRGRPPPAASPPFLTQGLRPQPGPRALG